MMHNKVYKTIKEYSVMAFALALYVFSWTAFLIPNQITAGGVTGLSTILNYAFGLPVSLTYLVLNVVLLVAGTIGSWHTGCPESADNRSAQPEPPGLRCKQECLRSGQ